MGIQRNCANLQIDPPGHWLGLGSEGAWCVNVPSWNRQDVDTPRGATDVHCSKGHENHYKDIHVPDELLVKIVISSES